MLCLVYRAEELYKFQDLFAAPRLSLRLWVYCQAWLVTTLGICVLSQPQTLMLQLFRLITNPALLIHPVLSVFFGYSGLPAAWRQINQPAPLQRHLGTLAYLAQELLLLPFKLLTLVPTLYAYYVLRPVLRGPLRTTLAAMLAVLCLTAAAVPFPYRDGIFDFGSLLDASSWRQGLETASAFLLKEAHSLGFNVAGPLLLLYGHTLCLVSAVGLACLLWTSLAALLGYSLFYVLTAVLTVSMGPVAESLLFAVLVVVAPLLMGVEITRDTTHFTLTYYLPAALVSLSGALLFWMSDLQMLMVLNAAPLVFNTLLAMDHQVPVFALRSSVLGNTDLPLIRQGFFYMCSELRCGDPVEGFGRLANWSTAATSARSCGKPDALLCGMLSDSTRFIAVADPAL